MLRLHRHGRDGAHGQILVLFVISLVVMMSMSALLFDAAQALVLKRQLQDAGDAAALAAANVIQSGTPRGCSATAGPPPGAPKASIVAAAQAAVTATLPGFDTSKMTVTCPDGWSDYAVQVSLGGKSPSFFGGIIGLNGFGVGTTSQAVNGQTTIFKYSVVTLDPSNLSFPNGYQGCPSVLLSGGPTVVLDGSVQIDSNCSSTNGGALSTNGNAAIVQMNNGSVIRMVGGYSPGPLTISPTPMTGQKYVSDPLAGLPAVPISSLPVQSTSRLTLSGSTTVLSPGVYTGGILMKNQAVALLQPGIYVMNGGGFAMGAQNAVYSVAQGVTTTSDSTWSTTDCLDTNCGILLYNTGTASGSGAMNQISVGAGATLRLKPYLPSADMNNTSGGATYRDTALAFQNLLFWQNANPVPTPSYNQPVLQLNGGGSVTMSGGVYAPSAITQMGGGSGGSGGTPTNLTIQFITWDLVLQGNSSFHFYYQSQDFPKPMDYGLIK